MKKVKKTTKTIKEFAKSKEFKRLERKTKRMAQRIEEEKKEKGIKTDFGKGLVVCLVKFAAHIDNDHWQRIMDVDYFYHKLKGDRKRLKEYDRSIQEAIEYADILMPSRKTPEQWISQEIGIMWAQGAADHLAEIEVPDSLKRTKLGKRVKELQCLVWGMRNAFFDGKYTVDDLERVRSLTNEIACLVDKKLGVEPDLGFYL